MNPINAPISGLPEIAGKTAKAIAEVPQLLTRPEVIAETGAKLGGLALEVGKAALPIAGIAYLTVAGIKTLFGYPPNWIKSFAPSLNKAA